MRPRVFVTGATGQDASFLIEDRLAAGYEVWGLVRRTSTNTRERLVKVLGDPNHRLVEGDLTDGLGIARIIEACRPAQVFNLGAISFVPTSWDCPAHVLAVNAAGAVAVFEACRRFSPESRIYQASTSEMYGSTPPPQDEQSLFRPRSPYAVAKVAAHYAAINYRESFGMHISCGVLFNHESERRGEEFVTRKITKFVARLHEALRINENLAKGLRLRLGNLDARRDWGYAPEYVQAMIKMIEADVPDDYVVATGLSFSVRDFVQTAFGLAEIDDWEYFVTVDEDLKRPAEVEHLRGVSKKVLQKLGWMLRTCGAHLTGIMLAHDIAEIEQRP